MEDTRSYLWKEMKEETINLLEEIAKTTNNKTKKITHKEIYNMIEKIKEIFKLMEKVNTNTKIIRSLNKTFEKLYEKYSHCEKNNTTTKNLTSAYNEIKAAIIEIYAAEIYTTIKEEYEETQTNIKENHPKIEREKLLKYAFLSGTIRFQEEMIQQ